MKVLFVLSRVGYAWLAWLAWLAWVGISPASSPFSFIPHFLRMGQSERRWEDGRPEQGCTSCFTVARDMYCMKLCYVGWETGGLSNLVRK